VSTSVAVRLSPRTSAAAAVTATAALLGAATALWPAAVLPALAVCAALGVLIVWPDAVTPAVVFVLFLDVPGVLVRDGSVPRAVGAIVPLLLAVPLAYRLSRRERLVFTPGFRLLLLFLAVQATSTFFSAHPEIAAQQLVTFGLEGIVVYFLVTNVVRTPAGLHRAAWAIVAAASLLATLSVVQNLTHSFWRLYGGFALVDPAYFYLHIGSARASGPVGDPNYYAQILLVALALALLLCLRERTLRLRLTAAAATVLIAVAVALTSSRGAAVAFVALLGLMVVLGYVSSRQLLVVAVGVTALLAAFPAYRADLMSLSHLGGATAATGSQDAADDSMRGRLTEMKAAALAFADHPLVGVGPDVFPVYYQEYAAAVGSDLDRTVRYGSQRGALDQRASHDVFLGVAADAGAAGLLVFVAIIAETGRALVRVRRAWLPARPDLAGLAAGFLLALAAYVAAGLFLTLAYERYFWLLIALAGAAGAHALGPADPEAKSSPPT
jgi:O-antigen ligase